MKERKAISVWDRRVWNSGLVGSSSKQLNSQWLSRTPLAHTPFPPSITLLFFMCVRLQAQQGCTYAVLIQCFKLTCRSTNQAIICLTCLNDKSFNTQTSLAGFRKVRSRFLSFTIRAQYTDIFSHKDRDWGLCKVNPDLDVLFTQYSQWKCLACVVNAQRLDNC